MKIDIRSKPIRLQQLGKKRKVDWIEKEGNVTLKVRKFNGKAGKWLCNILKRPEHFSINLDKIGSFIWKHCDGKNTVESILKQLENIYGKELMKERLFFFLSSLKKYGYIEFKL